jgi:lipopolysaccharide transport system ATP-binding protein
MMSETVIDVQDLSKRYHIGQLRTRHDTLRDALVSAFQRFDKQRSVDQHPTIWALKDVSFDIQQGQVVGVIGRNGAGKSTLLKILSQITDPTTGRIEIHGRVGSLLEVGTGFHHELTGRENIFLNGAILGMSRAEIRHKFDEIVAFAEVEKFIDTPVKRYSSGMYVRLAFAVAAHLEPEILVVDEVLAVGDAAFQKKCLGKMGDVAQEGRTVLFVSHNMAAVAQLCQKAVWLQGGRIRKIGLPEEVIKDYLSDSNTQIAERQWSYPGDAPGDDRVRLLAVRVLQQGRMAPVIDINIPSRIEIEFEALKNLRNLVTGINIYDATGLCLFDSCDWRPNQLTAGRYRKHIVLPAQLLAEGRIDVLVQLHFYDPDIKSVVLPNVLTIDAIDSDHPLAVRGLYKGPWPGVVRVHLDWGEACPLASHCIPPDTVAQPPKC